jgi:hypothetical protein
MDPKRTERIVFIMAQKKKSHKKPQNKAQNRVQNISDSELKKAYAQTPSSTSSKPMLLRIFILALVALMLLGIVIAAIAQ